MNKAIIRGRPRFSTQIERKFNGVTFIRTYHFARKGQARLYAAKIRKLWKIKVRIVGHVGYWIVYRENR
jgi:hypothetical protein